MKKLLVLLVALTLITGLVFAQENGNGSEPRQKKERAIEFFNWEFFVAFPVHWSNGMHDAGEFYPQVTQKTPDKVVTANTAIGTAINMNFTKKFGLALDFDFSYSTKLTGVGSDSSDSNSMIGMNVFFGPQFYLVNSDRLRLPLAIGAHMYYFADEIWMPPFLTVHDDGLWVNRTDLQIGIGLMFGVQFHFDNNIYIFSRTSVYLDFVRMHKVEGVTEGSGGVYEEITHSDIFKGPHWSIKPALGIGIKF